MDMYSFGIVAAAAIGILAFFMLRRAKSPQKNTPEVIGHIQNASKVQKNENIDNKSSNKNQSIDNEKKIQLESKQFRVKKQQQLQNQYKDMYFGSFKLKPSNSIYSITALDFKGSKILLATTKNQMILFNLKNWKKDSKHSQPEKYFVGLDNNGASAVCLGQNYYYAALTFDKTIVIYEFVGEKGIYFKQVRRFQRNLFKSNPSIIYVPPSQAYIVTAGSGADTVLDVWSTKGQRLINVNSFQIQHYSISCGLKDILIRGWTSEIKIFNIVQQKDGQFKKLDKAQPLPHQQSPLYSQIDNRDMYAVSISKGHKIKIWHIYDNTSHHTVQSSQSEHKQLYINKIKKCGVYTFEPAVGHFKTLVILAYDNGFFITDTNLKIIQKVEGIQINDIYLNGTAKSVILGVVNNQGTIMLWRLNKELEKVEEVRL